MQIHNLGLAPQALCFRLLRRLSKANSTFSSNTRSNLPLLKDTTIHLPERQAYSLGRTKHQAINH
jgi:hypothetical protein